MSTFAAFAPRRVRFAGVRVVAGFRLKEYHITAAPPPLDEHAFAPALQLAEALLPIPANATGRPGVGFLVLHNGNGADYAVLGWWDRENELPVRLFVREQRAGAQWRTGAGSESFCVWDLEVMWHERQAYVASYLRAGASTPEARYLADVLGATEGAD